MGANHSGDRHKQRKKRAKREWERLAQRKTLPTSDKPVQKK